MNRKIARRILRKQYPYPNYNLTFDRFAEQQRDKRQQKRREEAIQQKEVVQETQPDAWYWFARFS